MIQDLGLQSAYLPGRTQNYGYLNHAGIYVKR
jgi:hypothetical protein